MTSIRYRKADVDGLNVFYREAGRADAPALLLLHGFPTAGHMFRDLIPALSDRFRLVAPDLPGFGQSDMPARESFAYTFAALAQVIERFTEVIGLPAFLALRLRLWRADGLSDGPSTSRAHRFHHLAEWQCL
ncbi:pimeloyl-ACP methyl ester carboxylesterase [Bradyrhizobium japonicum]